MKRKKENMTESFKTISNQIVTFTIDEMYYALPLNNVLKVINAVEIRFLPKAPEIISGIVNFRGQILPVINLRKRFGLGERETELDDRMLIADTGKRHVVLPADSVPGIRDLMPGQVTVAKDILPLGEDFKGVAKTDDGLILIYDLGRFLSIDEEKELEEVLKLVD